MKRQFPNKFIKKMKLAFESKVLSILLRILDLRSNPYHPLAFINGLPKIGKGVHIGFFSEVNAKDSSVIMGDNCDIASFVSINAADSHLKCIGRSNMIIRKPIILGNNVFIGSHSFIGGDTYIGNNCVIGAGTILSKKTIPPFSLVCGNPPIIKRGYYLKRKYEQRN